MHSWVEQGKFFEILEENVGKQYLMQWDFEENKWLITL